MLRLLLIIPDTIIKLFWFRFQSRMSLWKIILLKRIAIDLPRSLCFAIPHPSIPFHCHLNPLFPKLYLFGMQQYHTCLPLWWHNRKSDAPVYIFRSPLSLHSALKSAVGKFLPSLFYCRFVSLMHGFSFVPQQMLISLTKRLSLCNDWSLVNN